MKPNLLNLFISELTRWRVVPIIWANSCWDSFGITVFELLVLAVVSEPHEHARQSLPVSIKELVDQILVNPDTP